MQNFFKASLNIKYFLNNNKFTIVAALLLLYGFFLRVSYLDPHYLATEHQRDYLIADHIVSYGEIPESGPINSLFGKVVLPVFYYLAAFILLFKNSIIALNFANIIFQIAVLSILYYLARKVFSEKTALLALILATFSNVMLRQSTFFSQIFEASLFMHLALLFSYFIAIKKQWMYVSFATFSIVIAVLLHSVAVVLLPGLIMLVFFIFKNDFKKIKSALLIPFVGLLIAVIGFLPAFFSGNILFSQKFVGSIYEFFQNLLGNIIFFLGSIFSFSKIISYDISANTPFHLQTNSSELFGELLKLDGGIWDILNLIILGVSLLAIGWYWMKNAEKLRYLFFTILTIFASQVGIMSFLRMEEKGFYHFIPLYGLFFILLAEAILKIRFKFEYLIKPIFVCLLLLSLSNNIDNFKLDFKRSESVDPIVKISQIIINKNKVIKSKEGISHNNFFSIVEYMKWSYSEQVLSRSVFWLRLEKQLGERLVEIEDSGVGTFVPIGKEIRYEYLACKTNQVNICKEYYFNNKKFESIEQVYSDNLYILFLVKL